MDSQHLVPLVLDRFSRGNLSYESSSSFYIYDYDYEFVDDFCNRTSYAWKFSFILIAVVLGIFASIFYLIVAVRHCNDSASTFLFLSNFLLANFINMMTCALFSAMTVRSHCWFAGKVLCKALPALMNIAGNAMIFSMVAIILEQHNPYVHSFLSKNGKLKKRTIAIVLWVFAMLVSIPEVFAWHLFKVFGDKPVCVAVFSRNHFFIMYLHKVVFLEYFLPLLLLIVTLTHALLSRRSNPRTGDQNPEENYSRNGENIEDSTTQCPPIRVTSVAIGVMFVVFCTPYYVSHILIGFHLYLPSLYNSGEILYAIQSIVAPVVILFTSPVHKKWLKETYNIIVSCIAGRFVKEGFLLSSGEEEEKLQEIHVERK